MKLKKGAVSSETPTASIADITFLLIVYFMVTTTFAATSGLAKEDDGPSVVEQEEPVLIEIQPGGGLLVDQKPMELGQILEYLRPKLHDDPGKPVIVKPDPAARYGAMVLVFDVLQQGKDELDLAEEINVSIPTQPSTTIWR